MTETQQLERFSTAELAAEVARRLAKAPVPGSEPEPTAATQPGTSPPKREWYPNKTIWATEMAKQARAVLARMEAEPPLPAGPKASRRLAQTNDLRDQIREWERKAKFYAQRGL